MLALVTTLVILLTLPVALYEGFLPNTNQPDTITAITAEETPCVTPEAEKSTPPASSDEDEPSSNDSPPPNGNQDNNDSRDSDDSGREGSGDNDSDNSNNDVNDDEDAKTDSPGTNNDKRSPKPTKFKVKTSKNLAKKIQKKVKQGLNKKKAMPTPTPRSLVQFPQFPEGFPFNNKKTPTPTEKVRPTSPIQKINVDKPVIKTPDVNKEQTKANKKLDVPNAKQIQKNIKQKLKGNSKSRVQAEPCDTDSEDSGERMLYFKVKIQANVGTTSKLVIGATVRILQDGELIESLTTNEDGWAITRLPLGTYVVEVLDPDYKPAYKEVLIAQNEQITQGGIQIVLEPQKQQSSNQQTDTNTFSVVISVDGLESDLPIKGTIIAITQNGNSIASCTVEITSCGFSLPRGEYTVTTSSQNYQPTTMNIKVVGTDGSQKNPDNYFESFFISIKPYDAKNPAPKGIGPSSVNDVIQYNSILECFGQGKTAKKCTAKQKRQADLNKDGKIDQKDYNIFLYEIRIR